MRSRKSRLALALGSHPRGWKADVAYVPSGENRCHGSVLGIKLRRFCNGTRFRWRAPDTPTQSPRLFRPPARGTP